MAGFDGLRATLAILGGIVVAIVLPAAMLPETAPARLARATRGAH